MILSLQKSLSAFFVLHSGIPTWRWLSTCFSNWFLIVILTIRTLLFLQKTSIRILSKLKLYLHLILCSIASSTIYCKVDSDLAATAISSAMAGHVSIVWAIEIGQAMLTSSFNKSLLYMQKRYIDMTSPWCTPCWGQNQLDRPPAILTEHLNPL